MDSHETKASTENPSQSNIDPRRANRFVSATTSPDLFQSQNLADLKPYYGGQFVASRMSEVRKSIDYIRENWKDRAEFSRNLADFLKEKMAEDGDAEFRDRVDSLKTRQRNWGDIEPQQLEGNFEVIRLYTSVLGYKRIFSVLNSLFRHDGTTNDPKTIQTIVFLIELINIDLYNHCLKFPQFDNFTGTVYRGVGLNDSDFKAFSDLMKLDIPKRYIAVPLSLMSCTTNIKTAMYFIKQTQQAVLFKIHILDLKPAFLKYYRQRNPTGVVSTICAVNVKDLSDFPAEDEILLRGAFFQVLDFCKDASKNIHVLEVCMLNSNRDHLSSITLADPDARKMFGLMVAVTRNEFVVEYYKQRGNKEEAEGYQALLEKAKQDLALVIPNDLVYDKNTSGRKVCLKLKTVTIGTTL